MSKSAEEVRQKMVSATFRFRGSAVTVCKVDVYLSEGF